MRPGSASRSTASLRSAPTRRTTASSRCSTGGASWHRSSNWWRARVRATDWTFVADRATWIGLVPLGYGDGFRRDLTGTEVLVAEARRRVIGTISMDSFAVELPGPAEPGTPVTLIGDGLLAEEHARHAGTISYELAVGIHTDATRATRKVVDA